MKLAFIRLNQYSELNGHYNGYLRLQFDACARNKIDYRFMDLSSHRKKSQNDFLFKGLIREQITHVYFEWLDDIQNLNNVISFLDQNEIAWSATTNIDKANVGISEFAIDKIYAATKSKSLAKLFVWNYPIIESFSHIETKFELIPDYQSLVTNTATYDCCTWAESARRPIIGIAGQLFGYRGVDGLIELANKLPQISILLWGQGRWDFVNPKNLRLLNSMIITKQAYSEDIFMIDDAKLNHIFSHLDAYYFDGQRNPNPSGIVTRARGFGIPVLIESGSKYYMNVAKFDPGIRVGDFFAMDFSTLLSKILGTPRETKETASLIDFQDCYLSVWGRNAN